jgi:hypothetical protein
MPDDKTCLTCKWAKWKPRAKFGECLWRAYHKIPKAFYVYDYAMRKDDPYTDCPCWQAKEESHD